MRFHPDGLWMSRLLAIVTAVLLAQPAAAITLDSVSGTWSNLSGGTAVNFQTVGSENQVRWGDDVGSGQNVLGFAGSAPPSFGVLLDQEFEVGTLRYSNAATGIAPPATGVDLTVALVLTNGGPVTPSFTFPFTIDETVNAAPCPFPSTTPCSDRITFSSAFAPQSFMLGGTSLTLELLGFKTQPGGQLVSNFIGQENTTSSAMLFGRITAAPEPSSLLLLASGLAGLGVLTRRKLKAHRR